MALVKCGECGREVSDKATACPGCGAQMPRRTSRTTKLVLILFVAAGVLPIVMRMTTSDAGVSSQAKPNIEYQQQMLIAKAQVSVKALLKDGDSARFKGMFVHHSKDGDVVCGLVNAKNGFGAYAGYERFLSAGEVNATYLESTDNVFDKMWRHYCQ